MCTQETLVLVLTLPWIGSVTLGKSFHVSEPPLLTLQSEGIRPSNSKIWRFQVLLALWNRAFYFEIKGWRMLACVHCWWWVRPKNVEDILLCFDCLLSPTPFLCLLYFLCFPLTVRTLDLGVPWTMLQAFPTPNLVYQTLSVLGPIPPEHLLVKETKWKVISVR